jgi:hypothetical protein
MLATEFKAPFEAAVSFPIVVDPGHDLLLTRKETARLLRVSEGYMRHMGARLLPVVKVGDTVRHRMSDVVAMIERRTVRQADGETVTLRVSA